MPPSGWGNLSLGLNYGYGGSPSPGTCAIGCYGPPLAPLAPPPPPPPPQDCFAGPNPTCTAPAPPGSLLHDPWITTVVHDITNVSELFRNGHGITENLQPQPKPVSGTQPNPFVNGNPVTPISGDVAHLLKDIHDQHPAIPTVQAPLAGGQIAATGNGSGKVVAPAPPVLGPAPQGPPAPSGPPASGGSSKVNVTETTTPQTATGGSGAGQGAGGGTGNASDCVPQGAPEESGMIGARSVRFSQDSVSQVFKGNKGSVMQLGQDLASGQTPPEALPPIRLFQCNGNLYTLDNRRLFAGQMANVNLPYRMATQAEIDAEVGSKLTTPNQGIGVVMRGIGYFSWFGQ